MVLKGEGSIKIDHYYPRIFQGLDVEYKVSSYGVIYIKEKDHLISRNLSLKKAESLINPQTILALRLAIECSKEMKEIMETIRRRKVEKVK